MGHLHQPRPVDCSHHSDLAHDQHEFSLIWTDILAFSGVVSLPLFLRSEVASECHLQPELPNFLTDLPTKYPQNLRFIGFIVVISGMHEGTADPYHICHCTELTDRDVSVESVHSPLDRSLVVLG